MALIPLESTMGFKFSWIRKITKIIRELRKDCKRRRAWRGCEILNIDESSIVSMPFDDFLAE